MVFMRSKGTIFIAAVLLVCCFAPALAQTTRISPWGLGAHAGLNLNLAGVGYGAWIKDGTWRDYGQFIPNVANDGTGLGVYIGVNARYRVAAGLALLGRITYDNKSLTAYDDQTFRNPDNSFAKDQFDFHLSVANAELMAQLYILPKLYVAVGGGLGYKLSATYDAFPEGGTTIQNQSTEGNKFIGSFIGGFGYDLLVSGTNSQRHVTITPFVEANYSAGNFANSLSILSVRGGAQLSFSNANSEAAIPLAKRLFTLTHTQLAADVRRVVNEELPLLPYLFFNANDMGIPNRYEILTSADTSQSILRSKNSFNRVGFDSIATSLYRAGDAYYNILNIVGYRLMLHSESTITLIGSDALSGVGEALAQSVKKYLVESWGIARHRIFTQGQILPRRPSTSTQLAGLEQSDIELENRRVEIVSSDPFIMSSARVRSEHKIAQEHIVGVELRPDVDTESWQMTVTSGGNKKSYGPFTKLKTDLDLSGMIQGLTENEVVAVEVIVKTADGRILSEREELVLQSGTVLPETERHMLIYDKDDLEMNADVEKFVVETSKNVQPDQRVVVWAVDDKLGHQANVVESNMARVAYVSQQFNNVLKERGVNADVETSRSSSFGFQAPFSSKYPEGRMYNRCVIVDIVK